MAEPYYEDDLVRLYLGDCRQLAFQVPAEPVRCMWTDPPYGVSYEGGTADKLRIQNDSAEGLERLLLEAWGAVDPLLAPGAAIYVAAPAGAQGLTFRQCFEPIGWQFRQTLVWIKDVFVLGHSDYHYAHEDVLYAVKPGKGRWGRGGQGWYGDSAQSTVFAFGRPKRSVEHPTVKPLGLMMAHLRNSTRPGDLVLDPFSGSGSTLRAAKDLGRRAIGFEIEERFAEAAAKRLAQESLFGDEDYEESAAGKVRLFEAVEAAP